MRNRLAATIALVLLWASPLLAAEIHVTTLADSGAGSLREAIANAASGDTIVFDVTGTITLSGGELVIDKDLTIRGSGASRLAIRVNYPPNFPFRALSIRGGSTVAISGVTIKNGNGGIYNVGSTLTVTDSVFSDNSGCGVHNEGGTVSITNTKLSGNAAGLCNTYDASMSVTDSSVSGSFISGVFNRYYSTMTVTNSTVSGNSRPDFPGGFYNQFHAKLTITNSTISGNSASVGGGIYNYRGEVILINSTVSGNSARDCGGGIFNARGDETSAYGGWVLVINSTLSGNSAATGGAICNRPSVGRPTTLTLQNTLLASSPSGGNCFGYSTIISQGHNLSDDGTCVGFFTQTGDKNNTPAGLDPRGLQDNGGPTKTIALLATSPAVDAVPSGACTDAAGEPIATDQRGVERPQGLACDIGAYEFQTPAQATQSLMSAVRALRLPRGIERGLLAQLQAALNAIVRNDGVANVAARNHLQMFIYEVTRLQGTALTPEQAAELTGAARRILESLGGIRAVLEREPRLNRRQPR